MQSFFDFTKEKLQISLVENGFKRYLADQLFD